MDVKSKYTKKLLDGNIPKFGNAPMEDNAFALLCYNCRLFILRC